MNDMNNEKRINCHLEGLSVSEIPVKISCCKCKDCNNEIEQKAYRASAKRDLYARSPNGSRLKMTDNSLSFLSRCGASDIVGIRNVITRRTSVRRGYLPEKCTHANKESLFASVTWVMRLPRRIQRMLLVMTIPALTLLFTFATTAESWAGIIASGDDCAENDGESVCHWEVTENGELNITGVGAMKNYTHGDEQPYRKYIRNVSSIKIGDGIVSTGVRGFQSAINTKTITLPSTLKTISSFSFDYSYALENINFAENGNLQKINERAFQNSGIKSFNVPDTVTTLGDGVFGNSDIETLTISDSVTDLRKPIFAGTEGNAKQIKEIIIYDDINTQNWSLFAFNPIHNGVTFRCLGNIQDCDAAMNKYGIKTVLATEKQCNQSENYYFTGLECIKRPQEGTNITCEHEISGYVKIGNYCVSPENSYAKKYYTPAEANEWLKEEDNTITITFKK